MRPATGNNSPSANIDKVSVRIDSGGHSFSLDKLPKRAFDEGAEVVFTLVTHKTVLVPAELFDESSAAEILAVAGVPCAADEQPTAITADGDIVAVAAIAKSCAAAIARQFGERASFATPLLHRYGSDGYRLDIRICGEVSFLRLSDNGKLRFAEAVRTQNEDETLYYVQALNERFALDKYHIYIYGERAASTAKLLKRYFDNVKCE